MDLERQPRCKSKAGFDFIGESLRWHWPVIREPDARLKFVGYFLSDSWSGVRRELSKRVQLAVPTSYGKVARQEATTSNTANWLVRTDRRSHDSRFPYSGVDAMNPPANSDQSRKPEPIDRFRLILSSTSSLMIIVVCLFLSAGTWAWSRGWIFLIVVVGASIVATLYLRRANPDVIAGRVNRHEGARRWDLLLGLIGFLPTMLAILIVAGLDDGRYHWSHVPWWGCVFGYALIITGLVGVTWATKVNKFFEPIVRIQTDRGHKVIDTGPYAIIRHPGYAFGFLLFVGIPLALGSLWALIPAILLCPLLVLRTIWEDQTLRKELVGYQDYAQRVRFRLIPMVW